jgi:autotransporter-associated beta strand protein
MLYSLCGQLESLGYRHQLLAQPQMNVSLNITTFTQPMRIAPRLSLKQAQRSQPQSEVAQLSRSHSMCFSERLICVRQWLFCLSLAILGLSHLSADAQCLSPNPYAVNSNTSVNLVQDSGCTLGSFNVGEGITLSSPSGSPIIQNDGTITTITNNGIISGAELIFNGTVGSNITTIINTATMSSTIAAIRNAGVISLINNSGTISSNDQTVRNTGSILELINTGAIVGTNAGIRNSGVITTLHNQQGSNGGSPLTYSGTLPTKYRVLISGPTTFGKLFAMGVTGSTEFGVSRFSTISTSILNTTFANVLVGITPANLGLGSATTISDVSNGYSYTLTQTNLLTNSWSLIITACRDCQISSGTSVGLSSFGANSVLSGGTLVLLSGDSSSTAFSVTSESTIQKPNSGSATLSGVFSGAGGLTFTGAGTTILTGANTYSGGTIVSSGTLQGNTTSLQGAIVNNSQVVFDQATDGTYAGAMSGSGSLTKQNAGTLILTGANNYSGGTSVSSGTLQGNTTSLQGAIVNNSQVVFDQATDGTYAGAMSGSGSLTKQNAGTLILTGANNYSGGTSVSSGTLQGNTTSLQGAIVNNSQVVFDQATDGTYAGAMSGSGSLTKQNAGTLILTGANNYSGGTSVSSGTLQGNTTSLQGAIVNNSQVVFDQATDGTYAGAMSGSGSLTKQNAGTLILTGANNYSGGTSVSSGTLQGNTTSLQGAIVNNSQVVFDQATDGTYAGAMSGSGSLTKQNAGTLILTGANNYSGGTSVSSGTLQGNTTSLQGAIVNNSQVVFDQATDGTYAGAMSGSGSLTKQNAGTLILTGANNYSGGTSVSSGTLQGNTTSLQGAIVNNSQVVFDQATDGTYAGAMSGSGSLTKQNAGTLILTGANNYSGGTSVSSGTLQGNTTSLQGSITSNGKVVFDQLSTGTFSGTIAGLGAVVLQNSGTVVLSGANTYSGGTTVFGGTLSLAGTAPTGRGDVVISSAGTLMGTGTIAGNVLVSGVLKPGNSPGYLSFAQNLTLNSGSTYQQDIAGATQASSATPVGASGYYSFVSAGRQLTITSGATLKPRLANLFSASETGYRSSIYVPALGDKFRIITAGGITGRFTTLTQPAELNSGTQLIAFYNVNSSNSVDLATVPNSYNTTLNSGTTNAKSVAGVLDQLFGVNKAGTASSMQDSLLYAVAGQNAANLPDFARSLAGEVHAASAATLPQITQRVQQYVLARLGDYPMAPSQLHPAVNQNTVNVTSAPVNDGRAWGEIAYQRTERASNHAGHGYNSNLNQIVTGVDAYSNVELGLKLGGGISLSNTTVAASGGNSAIQQGSVFVYGKMSVLQDYVLDGMASVGLSSTNLSRNDPTAYTGGFSNKGVKGNDAMVSVGLSRAFDYRDVRITPYARLSYQYVGQAAYDEGASAAALSVGRMNSNGLRAVIGVGSGSLNKDPIKTGYTYRANLGIGAESQGSLNPTLKTTLGGYSSSVTVPTAGAGFLQAGLYGTAKVAESAYAYAGISAEARTGQTLYGGSVGLRVVF